MVTRFTSLCLKKKFKNWVSSCFPNLDNFLWGNRTVASFLPPDKSFSISMQSHIYISFLHTEIEPASNKTSPETLALALTFLIKWAAV